MTEIKRRTFLTEPGENLLLTADPITYIDRFERFLQASGLPPESVLATPLIATPLPVARRADDGSLIRWTGADPSFLWHPLMWLPPHLALRFKYRVIDRDAGGTDEDVEVESDAIWATRVALELVHSGLYNPEDGTWLDILAYYGLDVENPVDQARVELWLKGAADETLDTIDLTSLVVVSEDPEWGLRAAAGLTEVLVPAEWALISDGIANAISGQLLALQDPAERVDMLRIMGQIAAQALHDVPADPETGIDYIDLLGILGEMLDQPDADLDYISATTLEALTEITEDYRPSLEALDAGGQLAIPA